MTQNEYDQCSRKVAKLDPLGFLCWLLRLAKGDIVFRTWLDTRRLPFPGEPDRVCDTVAHVEAVLQNHIPWAIIVEFQLAPDSRMFGRLLIYGGQVWIELKPSEERDDRFWIAAAVVNLTGRGNNSRTMVWDEAGVRTELTVREINLCDLDAKVTLDDIMAGNTTAAILAFIPLMHNGGDSAIIQQWLTLASAEPDSRQRGDYGAFALLFSEPGGCRPAWKQALTGWNMIQSQTVTEWMGRGEVKGKVEDLLKILRLRFGAVPAECESAIRSTTDLGLLDHWIDESVTSPTLTDFRQAAQI